MDDKTNNQNILCPECQNSIEITEDIREGDIVECSFCGSELRVLSIDENHEVKVEVIQEEK
jgi:hypothetical protein